MSQAITRRLLIVCAGAAFATGASAQPQPPTGDGRDEWLDFRRRYLSRDGRIIDTGRNGISHSEGQGWGMLFAQHFDDRASFERIWAWTDRVLGRRSGDALHCWRFCPDEASPVSDSNNATDGDLFIALALARAGRRWNSPTYTAAATELARDILRVLVRRAGQRVVLLPGATGFDRGQTLTLNLSYYAFAAFDELAELVPSPLWAGLTRDGLWLLANARFGQWHLPPDWLSVSRLDGSIQGPWSERPPRFSFDAMRIPLHLAWARLWPPGLTEAVTAFWTPGTLPARANPAWVDLRNNILSVDQASPGLVAIQKRWSAANRGVDVRAEGWPRVAECTDYYPAALTLLSRVSAQGRAGVSAPNTSGCAS